MEIEIGNNLAGAIIVFSIALICIAFFWCVK